MAWPSHIGKYSIARSLGKGAMGMVYEGFDPVIERKVAIKTILPDAFEGADLEAALARFKREAQAGGRLQHPGIVGVYEYGNDGDMAFIVMEYVEGQELRRILGSGHRYELIDIFEIMKQLLMALDYSHRQGVVHRDIKPANLMVLPGPKVKVMDFGIARLASSNLTQVGTVVGTPTHMAPEQLMGHVADGRADLWAAGVILYELLTGTSPFIADTPAAVMHKVLSAAVPPPSSLVPSLPPGFDPIVMRALSRKPDERFQGAREFLAALVPALQGKIPSLATGATMRGATIAGGTQRNRVAGIALAPEVIAQVEQALARQIGPLARLLVQRSQAQASTFDQFVRQLAEQIEDEGEKVAFTRQATALQARTNAGTATIGPQRQSVLEAASFTAAPLAPDVLATAERALASYVGPLARILIREAAGKSGDVKELYAQLATHIDSDDEKREFLASLRA